MTSGVGNLKAENKDECGIVRPRYRQSDAKRKNQLFLPSQQIAEVATNMVLLVDETQAKGSGDVGAEEQEDESAAIVVGKAVIEEDT
jgi:hypothetical protein